MKRASAWFYCSKRLIIGRAEGFDESRGRPGKPQKAALAPQWRAFHYFLNLLRRWVRWFKTTNAHRAQPTALRHKRALKALLEAALMRRRHAHRSRIASPTRLFLTMLKHDECLT